MVTANGSPDWNGESYHRVSEPQLKWGLAVLDSLPLEGSETVLDAGCGSGRLTAHLVERLPRGKVIALDVSRSMLEVAQRELSRFGPRVELLAADLLALPPRLDGALDVVFSAATFHWVLDHAALFRGLARALKPGGRLRSQCGGTGNLAAFSRLTMEVAQGADYARYFEGFTYPAYYAGVEETRARLEAASFSAPRVWLTPAPTPFATPQDFAAFASSVVLRHPLARLPEALRPGFLEAVVHRSQQSSAPLTLDYVRLDIGAQRRP